MRLSLVLPPFLLGALLACPACSPEPQMPEANIACNDSQEARCPTAPLCMLDEARACRFCRCSDRVEDQAIGYGWPSTIPVNPMQAVTFIPPVPRGGDR
jgi:hypothetical protein